MSKALDMENKEGKYLDEKELFILYYLLRKKHISTLWSNVFTPNGKHDIHLPRSFADIATIEEDINDSILRSIEKIHSKMQSSEILSYLLELGKSLDEKGFSIYCNADYSLIEGGFLCNYQSATMYEYLKATENGRNDTKKYKTLNKSQKDFLDKAIENKDFNFDPVEFSNLATTPIDVYQEAILNKKADKDFIELVNKLITPYDGSRWDTKDAEKFLEIYYRHNKEQFKKVTVEMALWHESAQTKLAKLIFENTDIHLNIKNTKKLQSHLDKYIELFRKDGLDGLSKRGLTGGFLSEGMTIPLDRQFFGFKKQKDLLIKHIEGKYEEYQRDDLEIGHPYFEPEYIGDEKKDEIKFSLSTKDKIKDLFLFVHAMIALEHEKYLDIEEFFYGSAGIFDLYERGFVFKIRLKKNRKESAEKLTDLEILDKKLGNTSNRIFFNSKTAVGNIDGKEFRFKPESPAAEVFSSVWGMINTPLKRQDILIISGFYQEGEKSDLTRRSDETYHINDIAKSIRRALKIGPKKLINNDGNLTLLGKKLKSPQVN